MKGAFKGLRRLAAAGRILMEVRGLRQEMAAIRTAVDRIAVALEARNAHQWPQVQPHVPGEPLMEITYADNAYAQQLMEIELSLTRATGRPPTEDEVIAEHQRLHPPMESL